MKQAYIFVTACLWRVYTHCVVHKYIYYDFFPTVAATKSGVYINIYGGGSVSTP